MFYDNFREACSRKGTTITSALKAIGRSTSCTGGWSRGKFPGLDICMELSEYLGIGLDELVYGKKGADAPAEMLSSSDREWLEIVRRIPLEKQELCKDFMRTHMVVPEKYQDKKNA